MKLLLSFALFFVFLICPAACAEGVRDGLTLAARDALPALFPFFVASGLLVRTGAADRLARLAARPLARLYHLPPAAAPAVLLGLTGGYPVGAATLSGLLAQKLLSPADAARACTFCNCASPGFCIALVGLRVFGSARTGALLYAIHALAALLTGLLLARADTEPQARADTSRPTGEGFSAAFCGAVQQAASTALTVTAFLTIFSVLLTLLRPVLYTLPGGMLLCGGIELTNGLLALPLLPLPTGALLTLASFLLGFGGLAVQFQVRALLAPHGLALRGFALAKLLHGALAAAMTAALFRLLPAVLSACAPCAAPAAPAADWTGAATLLLALFAIGGRKKVKTAV